MYTFIVNKSTKTKVSIYNTLWPSFAVTLFGFTADLMVQNMRDAYTKHEHSKLSFLETKQKVKTVFLLNIHDKVRLYFK